MIFTALWPLIEITMFGGVFYFLRLMDRGFTSNVYKTYMPSVQTYIDLHAGPEFDIHWRYSAILFQLSISLFFGTGIPLLYPISLVGCFIQYTLDRLLVCYFYREPPTYDDRITQNANDAIKFIATVSLIGTWFQLRSILIFQKGEKV